MRLLFVPETYTFTLPAVYTATPLGEWKYQSWFSWGQDYLKYGREIKEVFPQDNSHFIPSFLCDVALSPAWSLRDASRSTYFR
jgi:hypothetical protein